MVKKLTVSLAELIAQPPSKSYHGQGHGQLVARISSETPCLLAPHPHPRPPPLPLSSPLPPLLTALAHPLPPPPPPPPLWRPFQSRSKTD